jgi:hypothetical protein
MKKEIVGFSRPFHSKREAYLAKGLAAYLGMKANTVRKDKARGMYWLQAQATLAQVATFAAMEARRRMGQERKAKVTK